MNINNQADIHFGKFKKITAEPQQIERIREYIPEKYLTIAVKKNPEKTNLYLISGKHMDRLISAIKKQPHFFEIRHNLEKYLKSKPKEISYKKAVDKYM